MLKIFKGLTVALVMMFLYTNAYASPQADEQPIDTEAFLKQLQELQKKLVEVESDKEGGQQNDVKPTEDKITEPEGVKVEISNKEEKTYYYYQLTFVGLVENIKIEVKKDVVRFMSDNRNRANQKSSFSYEFIIPNPHPARKAEVRKYGNQVNIKVPKYR